MNPFPSFHAVVESPRSEGELRALILAQHRHLLRDETGFEWLLDVTDHGSELRVLALAARSRGTAQTSLRFQPRPTGTAVHLKTGPSTFERVVAFPFILMNALIVDVVLAVRVAMGHSPLDPWPLLLLAVALNLLALLTLWQRESIWAPTRPVDRAMLTWLNQQLQLAGHIGDNPGLSRAIPPLSWKNKLGLVLFAPSGAFLFVELPAPSWHVAPVYGVAVLGLSLLPKHYPPGWWRLRELAPRPGPGDNP